MFNFSLAGLRSIRPVTLLKYLGWLSGGMVLLLLFVLLALGSPFLMDLLHFGLMIVTVALLMGTGVMMGLLLTREFRGVVAGGFAGGVAAAVSLVLWFPNAAQLERICYEYLGYSVTKITLDYEGAPPSMAEIEDDIGALVKSTALHITRRRSSRYGGHWEKDVRPGYLKLEGTRLEVVTGQSMEGPHVKLLQAVFTEAFGASPSLPSPLHAEFRLGEEEGSAELDPRGARLSVIERDSFQGREDAFLRGAYGEGLDRAGKGRRFDLILEVPVRGGSGSLYLLGIPDSTRRIPLHFSPKSGLGEVQALGVAARSGQPLMMQIYLSSHESVDPESMVREQGLALAPAPWRADLARAVFPKLTAHPARVKIEASVQFSPRYTTGFKAVRPD